MEIYRQKSYNGKIEGNYAIYGSGSGVNGSLQYSDTRADLKTVNEQTGLFAGEDGIYLTVGGNTHLDGAVIASKADKDKNYFSTGTLTFNNIANEKSYESTAGSVSFSAGTGGMSFVPTLSHFEDEEHGTTHAAIFNNGTVEVRNGNLHGISRDTTNANNGSLQAIDYDKYAEQQEVSQLIGEVGASTVKTLDQMGVIDKNGKSGAIARGAVVALQTANNGGNAGAIAVNAVAPVVSYEIGQHYKEENAEGSLGHIAMHAGLGAATAYANGGNALAGAVSAGAAEWIAPKISEVLYDKTDASQLKESEKDTVLGVSSAIGALGGGAIGGNTQNATIGFDIAKNAVENNSLHIAKNGVVAQNIDDGDMKIYQYNFTCDPKNQAECRKTNLDLYQSSKKEVGQVMWQDSFTSPDENVAVGMVFLGQSIEPYVYQLNDKAENEYYWNVARKSFPKNEYDIKNVYPGHKGKSYHGFLFQGKYITLRDAGNILAGMNAASSGVSFDDFQRISGALHTNGRTGAINAYFKGTAYSKPPMYGELPYQYHKSRYGYDLGIQKIIERNERTSREKSLIPANVPNVGDVFNAIPKN